MCGCEKHSDKSAECTCICPEHASAYARKLIQDLRRDVEMVAATQKDTVAFAADCVGVAIFMGNGLVFYADEANSAELPFTMTNQQRAVAIARLRATVHQIQLDVPIGGNS